MGVLRERESECDGYGPEYLPEGDNIASVQKGKGFI